ncbi:hypothetical protein [Lacipirellula limnantheis]|uniref:Uncharacterized protein n=1 Tax=Lacipirellula limnantheis TaxID=2528024 RepID=A0A517TRF9_9BACT|nr:hypothetical protein [Lacipirellula limnantheis]QDT70962.1 hypothetical protein I41_01170 [Lacipirellula limnantheis]
MKSSVPDIPNQLLWDCRRTCHELGGISLKTLYNVTEPRGDLPCVRLGVSGRIVRYDADVVRQYVKDRSSSQSAF